MRFWFIFLIPTLLFSQFESGRYGITSGAGRYGNIVQGGNEEESGSTYIQDLNPLLYINADSASWTDGLKPDSIADLSGNNFHATTVEDSVYFRQNGFASGANTYHSPQSNLGDIRFANSDFLDSLTQGLSEATIFYTGKLKLAITASFVSTYRHGGFNVSSTTGGPFEISTNSSSQIEFAVMGDDSTNYRFTGSSNTGFTADEEYIIVMTIDCVADKVILWMNGSKADSLSIAGIDSLVNYTYNTQLNIGNSSGNSFLNNVETHSTIIYTYKLSDTEIDSVNSILSTDTGIELTNVDDNYYNPTDDSVEEFQFAVINDPQWGITDYPGDSTHTERQIDSLNARGVAFTVIAGDVGQHVGDYPDGWRETAIVFNGADSAVAATRGNHDYATSGGGAAAKDSMDANWPLPPDLSSYDYTVVGDDSMYSFSKNSWAFIIGDTGDASDRLGLRTDYLQTEIDRYPGKKKRSFRITA